MSLKHCLNWKVIAALGIVALGVFIVAPGLIGRVLPVLLVAICPLSMLAMVPMMARMNGGKSAESSTEMVETTAKREPMLAADGMSCSEIAPAPRRLTTTPDLAALKAEASALAARQEALAVAIAQVEVSVPAGEHA